MEVLLIFGVEREKKNTMFIVRTSTNDITGETRGMEGMSWNENTKQKDTFTYYLFLRRGLLGKKSKIPGQSVPAFISKEMIL